LPPIRGFVPPPISGLAPAPSPGIGLILPPITGFVLVTFGIPFKELLSAVVNDVSVSFFS
jgi:hypothetical protein